MFIAGAAFPDEADFATAKIAIFLASLTAAAVGVVILWRRRAEPVESAEPAGSAIRPSA